MGVQNANTFWGNKMGPNIRALYKTGKGEINAKIDQSVVGKHKGDDGGTFGVEGGVQASRLWCF